MRANINLYNEDCLPAMKKMADNQYDLAIVDPPYGLGNINRHSKGKNKSIHKSFKWNDQGPGPEYFNELYRISTNRIIWGCNYFNISIKDVGRIIHNKILTKWSKGKNLSDCDIASQSFNKKIEYFEYQWSGNVQGGKINWKNKDHGSMERRIHPTQKPVALYKWLLKNYAKEGDKILDTHGGSMSIAIACWDYGYNLDLYEIDRDYFEAGKKRLETHKAQLQLYV